MHAAFYRLQVIASLAFLVSTSTPVRLAAQPVIRAEPVVVSEASLLADAAGVSQIQFAPTTPTTGRTLLNVAENVANLHLNAGGAGSFGDLVSLRGLSNTPYFSDPSVAVYFDDLPLGSAFTYPTLLFGFSSVTVARGPQPGRFGRAAEGGVITFSSPEGGAQPAGELRADIGNFNAHTGAFAVRTARAGKPAFHCATFNYLRGEKRDIDVDSFLCLTTWNNKFVKFRMTGVKGSIYRDDAISFVTAWIPLLWPK